uniref:Uncharacterized protein n=1 Tax=Timema poppense TaxID=170557 RepID=A0A7R9CLM6_TIMPO|nr:unnamed protein product [Timema poppensis]
MPSKISRGSILTSYKHKVEELRNLGRQWSLTEEEIDQVIQDSFSFLEEEIRNDGKLVPSCKKTQKQENKHSSIFNLSLKIMISVLLVAILFNILLSYHRPTYNFAVRNIQEHIYPTMKLLRWVTLPLVKLFPSITVWYDELCLVENPYFQSVDIDCWACEDVRSVLDLSETDDPNLYQPHIGFPYIVKGGSAILSVLFLSGRRLTRLEPTRALRKIFPRPSFVPTTVNVERFVLIDEPKAGAYVLPFPEGYKVFLMQGSGERLIVLDPVPGCNSNCTRVSVLLKPSYFCEYIQSPSHLQSSIRRLGASKERGCERGVRGSVEESLRTGTRDRTANTANMTTENHDQVSLEEDKLYSRPTVRPSQENICRQLSFQGRKTRGSRGKHQWQNRSKLKTRPVEKETRNRIGWREKLILGLQMSGD